MKTNTHTDIVRFSTFKNRKKWREKIPEIYNFERNFDQDDVCTEFETFIAFFFSGENPKLNWQVIVTSSIQPISYYYNLLSSKEKIFLQID